MTATERATAQLIKNISGFIIGWMLLASCFAWKWPELHPLRSLGMSLVAWLIIYAPMFTTFWVIPGRNHGIVLERALYPWETPSVDDKNKIDDETFVPKSQRGTTAPFVAKGLFEVPVGDPIDFVRTTKLAGTLETPDRNGTMYRIDWQAFLTAVRHPDFLPRYLLVSEEASEEFFFAGYQTILIAMFAFRDGNDVMVNLNHKDPEKNFNKGFNQSYGGDNYLHDDEKEHARSTRDAAIKKIVPIDKVAQAMQLKEVAKAVAEAMKTLVKAGMSPQNAARYIMSDNGGIEFTDIQFTGGIPSEEVVAAALRRQQGKRRRK